METQQTGAVIVTMRNGSSERLLFKTLFLAELFISQIPAIQVAINEGYSGPYDFLGDAVSARLDTTLNIGFN